MHTTGLAVRKTLTVQAPQAHCFQVFTEQMTAWWPIDSHKIGKSPVDKLLLEPHAGGRWYERGTDGVECDWGRVTAYEPPARLALDWQLNAEFAYDPNFHSPIEILFFAESPSGTRIEFEHRIDAFGEKATAMLPVLSSDGGWTGMLTRFAARAEGRQ